MMKQHNFEIPLYAEPSQHFKNFVKKLGNPSKTCMISYWRGKLTFNSNELDEKASVVPVHSTFSEDKLKKIEKNISLFSSKFNVAMSLPENSVTINIQLFSDISEEYIHKYGKNVKAILQVTFSCNELAAEIALTNFFTVIDSSR